jgi:hypothetical protein
VPGVRFGFCPGVIGGRTDTFGDGGGSDTDVRVFGFGGAGGSKAGGGGGSGTHTTGGSGSGGVVRAGRVVVSVVVGGVGGRFIGDRSGVTSGLGVWGAVPLISIGVIGEFC